MESKFILKRKNAKVPFTIFLYATVGNKRMYLTTKQHVKKKSDFSSREQLVKSSVPNSSSINKILRRYKKQLIAVIDEIEKREIELTRDEFKYRLELKLGLREDTRHAGYYSMWDYFDLFIEEMKEKRGENSSRYFKIAKNKLHDFNQELTWKNINKRTYKSYVSYLEKLGHSKNYIGTLINRVRIMCNRAWEEEVQRESQHKEWKRLEESVDAPYLTDKEIVTIRDLKIKQKGRKQARDLFIIGCYTGLRSRNYLNLKPKEDVLNDFLYVRAVKGGDVLKIPLHPHVKKIFNQYDWELPKMAQQTLNNHLKKIAQQAGVKDTYKYLKTVGGIKKEFTASRFELIKSHTARRSFATNLIKREAHPEDAMNMTGHKTEREFRKYIRIEKEESAERLRSNPYFNE